MKTLSKTNAIWLVACIIGRAKNIGLFGQSLTKLAIIYAVAIRLIIHIIRCTKKMILSLYQVAWERSFRINDVYLEMMPFKMPFEKHFPMFHSFKLCRRYLHNRSREKKKMSLYQVDVQTKHAQNEKHCNGTKTQYKKTN